MVSEERFLGGYDPRAYPPVAVTVDIVALTIRDNALHVLLIQRAEPPYQGFWRCHAARRPARPHQGRRRDSPGPASARTPPRVHFGSSHLRPASGTRDAIVSVAHSRSLPNLPGPIAGSDAGDA